MKRVYTGLKRKEKEQKQTLLQQSYAQIDQQILAMQQQNMRGDRSGTTAVSVIVDHNDIVTANIGDTRAVLCRAGQAIELSVDHKPTDLYERRRIESANGRVTIPVIPFSYIQQNRNSPALKALQAQAHGGYAEVGDKGLAVSRAFGDISFKLNKSLKPDQQVVIAVPTIKHIQRDQVNDEFILLCTDGLTNIADNSELVEFIRQRLINAFTLESYFALSHTMSAVNAAQDFDGVTASTGRTDQQVVDDIAAELTQFALELDSNDNITAVIAVFDTYITALKRAGITRALQRAEAEQREGDRQRVDSTAQTPNAVRREKADHLTVQTPESGPADMFTVTAVLGSDEDISNVHPSNLGPESVQTLNRLQRTIYSRPNLSATATHSPLPADLYTPQPQPSQPQPIIDSGMTNVSADQLQQMGDINMSSSMPVKLRSLKRESSV